MVPFIGPLCFLPRSYVVAPIIRQQGQEGQDIYAYINRYREVMEVFRKCEQILERHI